MTLRKATLDCPCYLQLSHFHRVLDLRASIEAMRDEGARAEAEKNLAPISGELAIAVHAIDRLRDGSEYRWVDLEALYGTLAVAVA
jgi:hypothetical protein